jgi:hypothetical protein
MAGETTDLFVLVRELRLSPEIEAAIAADLQDYSVKLDQALQAREQAIDSGHQRLLQAIRQGDSQAIHQTLADQARLRIAVRNVNDSTAQAIASGLPRGQAEQFTQMYRSRAYGRVFRPTKTQRLFKAVSELPGLPADVLAGVQGLEQSYQAELVAVNESLLKSLREHEPQELIRRQELRWRPQAEEREQTPEEPAASPLDQGFARRAELDRRFAQQLQSVVPTEQWESLAKGQGE